MLTAKVFNRTGYVLRAPRTQMKLTPDRKAERCTSESWTSWVFTANRQTYADWEEAQLMETTE